MKKLVCLVLVALTLMALALPVLAADQGLTHGGRLNLRKSAKSTATIIGYIPNNTYVDMLDNFAQHGTTDKFYHIIAPSYLSGQTAAQCVKREGYGACAYIWID